MNLKYLFGLLSIVPLSSSPFVTVHGKAEFRQISESTALIAASNQSILEWETFSIPENGELRFVLPDAQSILLNRVVGGFRSEIFGKLESNGKVILVNPFGFIFGSESKIQIESLLATTFDLQNELFLEGKTYKFNGESTESIIQNGLIVARSGDVALLAHRIECQGQIESTHASLFAVSGMDHVYIRANQWSRGDFSSAFHHPDNPSQAKLTGTVMNPGGSVLILGDWIEVSGKAIVDVSSLEGRGAVWIGGDFQGQNSEWCNSKRTWIGPEVCIHADALSKGDGGKVIVWADEATACFGQITACGGALCGNGGFIEISGSQSLDFHAKVSTNAPYGNIGMLLLDPNDITISSGATTGGAFPVTGTFFTGIAGTSNLNVTELQNALNNPSSVTIQTNAGVGGGSGNISAIGPFNLTWGTGANLTLNASNTITIPVQANFLPSGSGSITLQAVTAINISGNIQNTSAAGGGDVNLYCSGVSPVVACPSCISPLTCTYAPNQCPVTFGTITIQAFSFNGIIPSTSVSVGSRSGVTRVSSDPANLGCYPDLNILVPLDNSGTTNDLFARLGFFTNVTPPGAPPFFPSATGQIVVNAHNINMIGLGNGNRFDCHIGSGNSLTNGAPAAGAFTTNTPITVNATGSIFSTCRSGNNRIGNGGGFMTTGSQAGNIIVNCNGNLTFQGNNSAGITSVSRIGNGFDFNGTNVPASGNIVVNVNGDITLSAGSGAGSVQILGIGHTGNGAPSPSMSGDVDIRCGGSVNMSSPVGGTNDVRIFFGHQLQAPTSITSNLRVSVRNNINMIQGTGSIMKIGFQDFFNPIGTNTPIIGNVTVIVGNNLVMSSNSSSPSLQRQAPMTIGYGGSLPTNLYLAVGGSIQMTALQGRTAPAIYSNGSAYISVMGNITVSDQASGTLAAFPFIGNRDQSISSLTQIRSFGNIIGSNNSTSVPTGQTIFGMGPQAASGYYSAPATRQNSLIMQASGDIQLPSTFQTQTGNVLIEADANFTAAGALWTVSGGNIVSIGGQILPVPISLCNISSGASIASDSPVKLADQLGAVSINTGNLANQAQFITTTGNITIHSAATTTSSGAADLTIGTASNNMQLTTASGNLTISGTIPSDSLRNIIINGTLSTTAPGSVFVSANNAIQQGGASIISTNGAGTITLIADQDDSGQGDLTLQNVVSTTNGAILLDAGFGSISAGPSSSINLISTAAVSSLNAPITLQAAHNISINGANPSIQSVSGPIQTTAGDNTSISKNVLTAGAIQMITGNNMLVQNATISSTGSNVDLVVDNDFPVPPLIGTGSFSLDAASHVNAFGYLRIYTARQSLNSILGLLNGIAFSPGILYSNTSSEVWCTYYPNGALGIPSTLFYKDCLSAVTQQATVIIDQFLVDLHPFDEFPGWLAQFYISSKEPLSLSLEKGIPYGIRRRQARSFNHPKVYTQLNLFLWREPN